MSAFAGRPREVRPVPGPGDRGPILVVEDDRATVELEKRALESLGLPVRTAGRLHEATALLKSERFSVVVLDYRLPDGYGWPVLEVALGLVPRIPVIVVTSVGDERVAAEVIHRGGSDYLIKTNEFYDLLPGAVERVLRRAQAERSQAELQEQLRQSQKMEAIGQLAGGIAHDFNNVLTAVLGYCDLLESRLGPGDPSLPDVGEIRKAGTRAASLTRQLQAFSRQQFLQPRILSLNDVVRSLETMLRRLIGEDIELRSVLGHDLGLVLADQGQFEQALMSLAVNARAAMPRGGILTIETGNVELDERYRLTHDVVKPGAYVRTAVSDSGVGMSPEVLARIFEPFFTTKEPGKETGLGLSTVYGNVKQSGGHLWAYSEPDRGTTFKIYLPRVEDKEASREPEPPERSGLRGDETILLVEDEPMIRNLAREILAEHGYFVHIASRGEEALRLSREYPGPIDLLLIDVVMPGGGGPEWAERLSAGRPAMKILYMSGYTDDAVVRHGLSKPGVAFLQKPFTATALVQRVRRELGRGAEREAPAPRS